MHCAYTHLVVTIRRTIQADCKKVYLLHQLPDVLVVEQWPLVVSVVRSLVAESHSKGTAARTKEVALLQKY
jgi:hypothetical protein